MEISVEFRFGSKVKMCKWEGIAELITNMVLILP